MRARILLSPLLFLLLQACQKKEPRSYGWIRPGSAQSIEFGGAFFEAYGWRVQNYRDTTYYYRLVIYEKFLEPVLDAENLIADFNGKGNFLSIYFHSAHPIRPVENRLKFRAYDYEENRYPAGAIEQSTVEYDYGKSSTEPISYRDQRYDITKGAVSMQRLAPGEYRFEGVGLENLFSESVELFYQGPVYLNDYR